MTMEKDIGGGGKIKVAEKDPLTHIDLELMNNLERSFKEALQEGFKGTFDDYMNSLSDDQLKTLFLATGGPVKEIKLAEHFEPNKTVSSLTSEEKEKVKALLQKMLKGKKDN